MLHRSWGPMEPFDDSMPELLKNNNIYTHLISDHVHYWEDGGATYHYRYNSWENIRGQEGDMWKCLPELFAPCDESKLQNKDGVYFHATQNLQRHDAVNRKFMKTEEDTALAKTIHGGLEFIDTNHDCDRWFLQIECFDPHEPFYTLPKDKELYMPEPIYKEQEITVANFPKDIKYADMTGIDDITLKESLLDKWKY